MEHVHAVLVSITSADIAWHALLTLNGTENSAYAMTVMLQSGASDNHTPSSITELAAVKVDTSQLMESALLPLETLITHNLFSD